MGVFCGGVERQLCECLACDTVPEDSLVQAIASAKVKCIELAIELCWRLKQEVGSYALMSGTGFEQLDYLQCCKFAEGDSRVLMQKMARDRVKAFQKGYHGAEDEALIVEAMLRDGDSGDWTAPYRLADAVIKRNVAELTASVRARL